jgi:hypothetical protein
MIEKSRHPHNRLLLWRLCEVHGNFLYIMQKFAFKKYTQFLYVSTHNILDCYLLFYTSPNIIRIIKSTRMRCAGHVARTAEKRNAYRIMVGKPEGKTQLLLLFGL